MEPAQTTPKSAAVSSGHVQSQKLRSEARWCFATWQGEGPTPGIRPQGGRQPRLVTRTQTQTPRTGGAT